MFIGMILLRTLNFDPSVGGLDRLSASGEGEQKGRGSGGIRASFGFLF